MNRIYKRNRQLIILSALLMIVLTGSAFSFYESENCKGPLKKYLDYLRSVPYPKGETVHYYKLRTISVSASDNSSTDLISEMWVAAEGKSIYKDPTTEYFRDQQQLFLVRHDKKQIMSSSLGTVNKKNNHNESGMDALKDSLLLGFAILDCREIMLEGNKVRFLSMKPDQKYREQSKIDKLDYYLSLDNKYLYRMVTYYTSGYGVKKKSIDYLVVNYNDRQNKFKIPARENIYAGANRLQEKFRNYKIITK